MSRSPSLWRPRFPAVLMYHHVERLPLTPPPVFADSYVDRDAFARQLDTLRAAGLATVTFARACELAAAGASTRGLVVLTFDDACSCFATQAAPELARRGMTATVFAVSGSLGGSNTWDHAAGERHETLLDPAGLRALAAAGFEIASHGREHRDLTQCDDAEQHAQLAGSRADLATVLGSPARTFCYPYGHCDARATDAARRAGYLGAASIHGEPAAHPRDPYALARMIVRPDESPFELRLKARGWYPLWSRLPRFGVLRALRGGGGY